jgi:hypothetical protein
MSRVLRQLFIKVVDLRYMKIAMRKDVGFTRIWKWLGRNMGSLGDPHKMHTPN